MGSEDQERQATEGDIQGEAVLFPSGEFVPVKLNLYSAQPTEAEGEGQEVQGLVQESHLWNSHQSQLCGAGAAVTDQVLGYIGQEFGRKLTVSAPAVKA